MAPSDHVAVPFPAQNGSKLDETSLIKAEAGEPVPRGAALERPSLKRKDAPNSGHRFKVVSQLVVAMKRFQGEHPVHETKAPSHVHVSVIHMA